MSNYNDFVDILNNFNLSIGGQYSRPVTGISSVLDQGKYNITYTIYDQDAHASNLTYISYLTATQRFHLVESIHYIEKIETALQEILAPLDNESFGMLFQDVANISFTPIVANENSPSVGVITFGQLYSSSPLFGSQAVTAVTTTLQAPIGTVVGENDQNNYGDIWINATSDNLPSQSFLGNIWTQENSLTLGNDVNIVKGTNPYKVLLEEISHALGIDAMQKSKVGSRVDTVPKNAEISNHKYSITTYNNHPDMEFKSHILDASGGQPKVFGPYPSGLQLYDIAALQAIYGRNYDKLSGDTVYSKATAFTSTWEDGAFVYTIWDGGGIDTIDAGAFTETAAQIDLRQGHFSSIGMNGDFKQVPFDRGAYDAGNVAIAFHAVIENANGGINNDILIGNAWNNLLQGNGGNDRLYGDGIVYETELNITNPDAGFHEEDDQRPWHEETNPGPAEDDSGVDHLYGGSGDDYLRGGRGADVHFGGTGNDTFVADGKPAAPENNIEADLEGDIYHGGGFEYEGGSAIAFAQDGDDTIDYSNLQFGIDVNLYATNLGTVEKLEGTSNIQDELISIEAFKLTNHLDKMRISVSDGASAYSIDGGTGGADVQYVGGWRDDYDVDRIYDLKGNLIYDKNETDRFKNIEVTHTAAKVLVDASETEVTYTASELNYVRESQYGGDFTVWHVLNPTTFPHLGTSLGQFVTDAEFNFASIEQTLRTNRITGTDNGDTFNLFQHGARPVDYLDTDHFYVVTGLGDDTLSAGFDFFVDLQITYRGGHDVYDLNYSNATIYIDDEIAGGDISVLEFIVDENDFVTKVVFDIAGHGSLTLLGENLAYLPIELDRGGVIEITEEDAYVYADHEFASNYAVELSWIDDIYTSETASWQSDFVYGLGGDDTYYNNVGNHSFYGGSGSDTFVRGAYTSNNFFDGGIGGDFDFDIFDYTSITGNMTYNINGDVISTIYGTDTIVSTQTVYLNSGNNTVNVSNQSSFALYATGGNVTYNGSSGDDVFVGWDGDDIIYGNGGDDHINGGTGTNLIYGGTGNDTIVSYAGTDTVDAGDGDDIIQTLGSGTLYASLQSAYDGGDGFDTLSFSSSFGSTITISGNTIHTALTGTDYIYNIEAIEGSGEDDIIYGDENKSYHLYAGSGDDTVYAGDQGDAMFGEAGADSLYGGLGNDTLDGGQGSDFLSGGAGDDTYVINHTQTDTIEDTDGNDRIVFGEGFARQDMSFVTSGTTLEVHFGTTHVANILNGAVSNVIETFEFHDGSTYDVATGRYTLLGTEDGDTLIADSQDDHLYGLSGDDTLEGLAGDDVLHGGDGDDILRGGEGDDIYVFSTGYDTIEEVSDNLSANDALFFGNGYLSQYLDFYRIVDTDASGHDDLIIDDGIGNSVTIKGQFAAVKTGVEEFLFSSDNWNIGDELSGKAIDESLFISDIQVTTYGSENANTLHGVQVGASPNDTLVGFEGDDTIYGYGGDDILIGGTDDDALYGGDGNDTYMFSLGDGTDVIHDTSGVMDRISFDVTVSAASVIYAQDGNDLTIGYGDLADTITVTDFFLSTDNQIEEVVFADNTAHDVAYILNEINGSSGDIEGTSGNDTLEGTSAADIIRGFAGDDVLYGYGGDDIIYGGNGHDLIYGGQGNDELRGGNGNDELRGQNGDDRIFGGAGDDLLIGGNGNDLLKGGDGNDILRGGDGDDILRGGNGNDRLLGGAGEDFLHGGAGADTFVFKQESAFAGVDTIRDFTPTEGDRIDIRDLLTEYDPVDDVLADFVQFTNSGNKSNLMVDMDGAGTLYAWSQIASISGHNNLDPDVLVASSNLLVS